MRRLAPLVALALLAGCGTSAADADPDRLADVAARHLDGATSPEPLDGSTLEGDEVGVQLLVGDASVQVRVGGSDPGEECDDVLDGCADLEDDDGRTVRLGWQDEEPEEDPGAYTVWTERDGRWVSAAAFGPVVDGDPREDDPAVPVEALRAVVVDPGIDE